jgi:hypothetical protein
MNKLTSLVFLVLIFNETYAQSDELQIKTSVETFLEGMQKRDTLLIRSVLHRDCSLNSVNISEGKPPRLKSETIGRFLNSIGSVPAEVKLEERLLEHKIHLDVALAIDWTPYEFYVNQKLSHQGTNVITLVKVDNSWKIFSIIDTHKK